MGAFVVMCAASLVNVALVSTAHAQQPSPDQKTEPSGAQPGAARPKKEPTKPDQPAPKPQPDQAPKPKQPQQAPEKGQKQQEQQPAPQPGEPVKGTGGSRAGGTEKKQEPAGTTYSLDALVHQAITNNDLVAEFKAKKAKAKWDKYKATHITWLPSIKSTTLASVVPANADPDEINRNFYQYAHLNIGPYVREELDVILPMYTFGKNDVAEKLAHVGLQNADLELEKARLDAIYQTKRAYWGLRLWGAYHDMLQDGSKLLSDQLSKMEEKREFGGADFDIQDYRKLQIFSAEVDSRVVDNDKLGTIARAGLHFLADIPEETRIEVDKLDTMDNPPKLKPRNYYVGQALEHRVELRQLDRGVRARQLQLELARDGWYPNLFAAFRLRFGWSTENTAFQRICTASSLDNATKNCQFPQDQAEVNGAPIFAEPYGDPLHIFSMQLGVGLRWNVDPFQQYGEVGKKEAQYHVVRAQRRRARNAVELDIKKLYQDAADALAKIQINHKRLKAAQRWRDQFGLSLQTAGADIGDAVQPLQAYYEARAKYLQSIYDYMVARAALAKGVGARGLKDDGAASSE